MQGIIKTFFSDSILLPFPALTWFFFNHQFISLHLICHQKLTWVWTNNETQICSSRGTNYISIPKCLLVCAEKIVKPIPEGIQLAIDKNQSVWFTVLYFIGVTRCNKGRIYFDNGCIKVTDINVHCTGETTACRDSYWTGWFRSSIWSMYYMWSIYRVIAYILFFKL